MQFEVYWLKYKVSDSVASLRETWKQNKLEQIGNAIDKTNI